MNPKSAELLSQCLRTGVPAFSCLAVLLLLLMSSCSGGSFSGAAPPAPVPPASASFKMLIESNSEAGTVTPAVSAAFKVSKGTTGGSYNKSRAASTSFIMTTGAIHAR